MAFLSLLQRFDTKTLTLYAGPILICAALCLLLIGRLFGRRFLRGFGVALWMGLITLAVVFSLFVMGDTAKASLWGLPVLVSALVCVVAAGEWSLRKLRLAQ